MSLGLSNLSPLMRARKLSLNIQQQRRTYDMGGAYSRLVMAAIALISLLIIVSAAYFLAETNAAAVVGLPMLAIASVVILISLLCGMSVVFASFELQDKTQALALPEGSIRAVIAMMLVVLFAVLSIYLYTSIAEGQMLSLGIVNDDERAELVKRYTTENIIAVSNSDRTFKIWVRGQSSSNSVDFAKQLLVLVGTLVTSISSFYFGSKVATHAGEAPQRASLGGPVAGGLTPRSYARGSGKTQFAVFGKNLEGVTLVRAAFGDREVIATGLESHADFLTFELDIPPEAPPGAWKLFVAGDSSRYTEVLSRLDVT